MQRRARRSAGGLAAGVALMLVASACSSSSGAADKAATSKSASAAISALQQHTADLGGAAAVKSMTALYQAALKNGENKVVIYGPSDGDQPIKDGISNFEKLFPGIQVQVVDVYGAALDQKVSAEASTGKHIGDIVDTGTSVPEYGSQGKLMTYFPVTAQPLAHESYDPNHTFYTDGYAAIGFLVNTKMMSKADAPQNWNDLANPKYKGKLTIEDPTNPGQTPDNIAAMLFYNKISVATLKGIAANQPLYESSSDLEINALVTGQRPIGVALGFGSLQIAKSKGAPVDIIFPFNGPTPMLESYMGILKTAPHPDAAKLLETYWLSKMMDGYLAQDGIFGLAPGAPGPAGYPGLDQINLVREPRPFSEITPNFNKTLALLKPIFH